MPDSDIKEKGTKAADKIAKILELPSDTISGGFRMEFVRNRELFIQGHRGIMEYTDMFIKINAKELIIEITGKNLELNAISNDGIAIVGIINSVTFSV